MSPEPGWYHADGDPPGTVRLWNGHDWVGFPQRDPNIAIAEDTVTLGPARGQQRLWPWGAFACVGLILPAIAYLLQAYVLVLWVGKVDLLAGSSFSTVAEVEATFELIEHETYLQLIALLAIGVGTLIAGILFVPWFFVAYLNVGKWARTRYEAWWAVVAWLIPIINLRRPSHIMQELCELSPRKDREGVINPASAWAWWMIFISTGIGLRLLQVWAFRAADPVTVKMILWISVGLCIATVYACGLAMKLVYQISKEQDLRFKRTTVGAGHVALARV